MPSLYSQTCIVDLLFSSITKNVLQSAHLLSVHVSIIISKYVTCTYEGHKPHTISCYTQSKISLQNRGTSHQCFLPPLHGGAETRMWACSIEHSVLGELVFSSLRACAYVTRGERSRGQVPTYYCTVQFPPASNRATYTFFAALLCPTVSRCGQLRKQIVSFLARSCTANERVARLCMLL